jgi:hypothetical protein
VTGRRKLLVTLHVLGATSNLGATVVTLVLLAATAFPAARAAAGLAPRLAEISEYAVAVPLLLAALLTGVACAMTSPWGLFRYGWVVKKLGLTLASLVIALTAVGPWMRAATAGGAVRWVVLGGLAAQLLLLVLTTVLSVYKPGGRIGRPPRPAEPALRRKSSEIKA